MSEAVFSRARQIWHDGDGGENEYAEFCDGIKYSGGRAMLRVSVCGDYTLFINGKYAASNQYADFPHYKIYDEIEISEFLVHGENKICFLVWYFGKSGNRYCTPVQGIIYEILLDGNVAAYSGANTVSRLSRAYESGGKKKISPQLGYSFTYDATKEDGWLADGGEGFSASRELCREGGFYKRPTKKLVLGAERAGAVTKTDGGYIVDFGEEVVGLLSLAFDSAAEQCVNIAYGELLENGHVKRIIAMRDFSAEYIARQGKNEYTNYMFRFACRYVEITCGEALDDLCVSILPQYYPVKARETAYANELDGRIYEISLNTLRLCMMEHYVDCPWREQCMYAFDSRNQMLCGYSAFEGGNFEYARANLLLMSKDRRADGLLSICFPSAGGLTIPSFSLYYILAVKEYLEYSGDLSLGEAVIDKAESILRTFAANMHGGEVCKFGNDDCWNFYDWSPYANFETAEKNGKPDFLINCIVIIALKAYNDICKMLGRDNSYAEIAEEIRYTVRKKYYNPNSGLFFVSDIDEPATELANSLAVVSGVADGALAEKICRSLAGGELIPCSLSMKCFKYDALIKTDKEGYTSAILNEIRQLYGIMLDEGATTTWETIDGAQAFDNAGSLCHGWSALPVHYCNLLMK